MSDLDRAIDLLRRARTDLFHACGVTIVRDSVVPIYGCKYPAGHEGPCETRQERAEDLWRIPSLEKEIDEFLSYVKEAK